MVARHGGCSHQGEIRSAKERLLPNGEDVGTVERRKEEGRRSRLQLEEER